MQYSVLLALSSALMAAGVTSERVAVPYGMNPSQAAAMDSAMNAPWAVPPPSAASSDPTAPKSMVSMHSSLKQSKATIVPGVANSAMAHPSMASPSLPSMSAMATPSPSSRASHGPSRNEMDRKHEFGQGSKNTGDTPSPPHGGLAPVSPMQPGSNVAPMGFDQQQHGQDIGNAFCLGQCYPSAEAAKCGGPYVSIPPSSCAANQLHAGTEETYANFIAQASPMWKKELGCYTCCFTAPDI